MSYFPEIVQDGLRFIIAKISDSRKELEIRLSSDNISQNETFIFNLGGVSSQITRIDFYDRLKIVLDSTIEDNNSDVVVPLNDGSYIPLVNSNYFKDSLLPGNDVKKILFVIKLNRPLPPSFKKLSKISLLTVKSEIVSNEIMYGGALEEVSQNFGKSLEYDYTQNPLDTGIKETSTYQNTLTKRMIPVCLKLDRNFFLQETLSKNTTFEKIPVRLSKIPVGLKVDRNLFLQEALSKNTTFEKIPVRLTKIRFLNKVDPNHNMKQAKSKTNTI